MDEELQLSTKRMVFGGIAAVLLLWVLIACVFGHPLRKTPADKIALSYGGGPFEGASFQKIVQPGSGLVANGFFDKWYEYPTTQRNYIISKNPEEGDIKKPDFIEAPSSDKIPIQWEVSVYFKLNTNIIRQFHETVGLKYHAWTDSGWDAMLHQTFRQQLEASVQSESRKHTSDEYQSSPAVIEQVRLNVASSLKTNINTVLGNEFFCGPNFERGKPACPEFEVVVKKPSLPQSVVDSYTAQKNSSNGIVTATNNAAVAEQNAKGQQLAQQALEGIYRDPNYIDYLRALAMQKCAENANCTLVVTQGTTAVNVNTGK